MYMVYMENRESNDSQLFYRKNQKKSNYNIITIIPVFLMVTEFKGILDIRNMNHWDRKKEGNNGIMRSIGIREILRGEGMYRNSVKYKESRRSGNCELFRFLIL